MSIIKFSDIEHIIIEIQTCRAHRPIIIGMYDHEYHIGVNSSDHQIASKSSCNQDIDNEYYISSISFEAAHNKFRFACTKQTEPNNNNCCICGFKVGASYKSTLSEWEWYKTIRSHLTVKNKSLIPVLFGIGYCHKLQRYGLILSINGVSLDQIIKRQPKNVFNLETSTWIFYKSVNCISRLHDMDIIHGDIKYGNIILNENGHNFGLIDFDSTVFYDKLSQNIINADHKAFYPFRGTPLFASVDAHQRKLLTKRSDLISLIFAVLYGMDKSLLPWNKKDVLNVMQLKKQRFVQEIDKYLKSRKFPKELLKIMHHILGLKYHEIPDYQYIKSLLESLLRNIDTKLIECGPKQIEFLNYLKDACYKEYKCNINKMDVDY